MFIFWLHRAVVAFLECLRLTHCAHAALTIGHDWSAIIHGSVPTSSVFATYVVIEAVHRFAKLARRAFQARRARRALQAMEVVQPAAPTSAEA